LELKVASWGKGFESLAQNVRGIFEARKKCTAVNIVKFFAEVPFILCVIDFKTTVGRNAFWSVQLLTVGETYLQFRLDCTQVGSQYMG
jgi:hypothetical protein